MLLNVPKTLHGSAKTAAKPVFPGCCCHDGAKNIFAGIRNIFCVCRRLAFVHASPVSNQSHQTRHAGLDPAPSDFVRILICVFLLRLILAVLHSWSCTQPGQLSQVLRGVIAGRYSLGLFVGFITGCLRRQEITQRHSPRRYNEAHTNRIYACQMALLISRQRVENFLGQRFKLTVNGLR